MSPHFENVIHVVVMMSCSCHAVAMSSCFEWSHLFTLLSCNHLMLSLNNVSNFFICYGVMLPCGIHVFILSKESQSHVVMLSFNYVEVWGNRG